MSAALSRRAALTGAVASVAMVGAAVVVAAPVASADRAAWDAGFARWQASYAAAAASGWDDDLTNLNCGHWSALMHAPAPDAKALHWKLSELFGEGNRDGSSTSWDQGLVALVVDDARRLAGMEVAA